MQINNEEYEKAQEQKAVEIEMRRTAIIKKADRKWDSRRLHLQRRETLKAEAQLHADRTKHQRIEDNSKVELKEKCIKTQKLQRVPTLSHCEYEAIRLKLIEQKVQQESQNDRLIKEWYRDDDYIKQQKEKLHQQKLRYRGELQNQLIDNRIRLREREEERHRERKIFEEVAKRMHNEDRAEAEEKRSRAAVLRKEYEAFLKARQVWKDKRRNLLREEHDDIWRVIIENELRERKAAEAKTDKYAAKEEQARKIVMKIMEEELKKKEKEEICRELYLAKLESKISGEAERAILRKKAIAKELLETMESQRKAVSEKKAKEKASDAAFAKCFAEEHQRLEEKEKEKENARRENNMQYGQVLRDTIMQNKVEHALGVLTIQEAPNSVDGNILEINVKDQGMCCDDIPQMIDNQTT